MLNELTHSDLVLDFSDMDFKDIAPGKGIIGQDRALKALRLGFEMKRPGYNIFISGDEGTARRTAAIEEIKRIEGNISILRDVAYAVNMNRRSSPLCLIFAPGEASEFQKDLDALAGGTLRRSEMKSRWKDEKIARFIESLPEDPSSFPEAFRINIVLDRKNSKRRPLVIESHPSHDSLFGFIKKDMEPHLAIELGSYQNASGGFLMLSAEELLHETGLWTTLKRYIDMTDGAISSTAVAGELIGEVRPSPIPLPVKVILIGNDETYDNLAEKDEEFLKLFKIAPEFDYRMDRNKENSEGTIAYIKSISDNLLPMEDTAYMELLRYSSWFAENRNMLSTQLSLVGDLAEEADIVATEEGKTSIGGEDVREAIRKRNYLASLTEERINRDIKDGELLITLEGRRVGMVNGLAVMDRGLSSFGTPTVISATAAPGNEGIVNIEHEAGLSGGIHDKGLLILEGYLRHKYAKTFPLSLYAGICFEQSYAEVDGDSASSAELYALLSAIGDIPLRQDIAITGSVNQMGELQPVGGINEKIEGFYNACRTVGLTGRQGVIIPIQNISSLILPYEVEDAVKAGNFHIYSIEDIEDGFEILTDLEAGDRNAKGAFPSGSFNRIVEDALKRLCQNSQRN